MDIVYVVGRGIFCGDVVHLECYVGGGLDAIPLEQDLPPRNRMGESCYLGRMPHERDPGSTLI